MSFKELTLVGAMALALAACGGGGGGGGRGDEGGGGGSSTPVFGGNASPAPVNESSMQPYLRSALDLSMSDAGFVEYGRSMALPQRLDQEALRHIKQAVNDYAATPLPKQKIDETLACDSGNMRFSGDPNDQTGQGVVSQSFNRCVIDGITLTGSISINFIGWDNEKKKPVDMDVTFSDMRAAYGDFYVEIDGTVNQRNMGQCEQSVTYNVVWELPGTAEDTYYQDLHQKIRTCGSYELIVNGRVYLGDQGYMDVTTLQAMSFNSWNSDVLGDLHGMRSGHIVLQNANGRVELAARVDESRNDEAMTNLKRYQGTTLVEDFDFPSFYLSDPVLADLSDEDNDGMLDGWERFYGLVVGLDDSMLDDDDDGFNNLAEFRSGHNPRWYSDAPYVDLHAGIACVESSTIQSGPNLTQATSHGIQPKFVLDIIDPVTSVICDSFLGLEVGEISEFDVVTVGTVSESAAASLEHYRVEAALSPTGDWSIAEGDGCVIQDASSQEPRLICDELPLAPFVDGSGLRERTIKVIKLVFRAREIGYGYIDTMTSWAKGVKSVAESFSFYIDGTSATMMTRAPLHVFEIGRANPAYAVFSHMVWGEGWPIGYSFEARLDHAAPGLKFLDPSMIDGSSYQNCVVSDFELSCRYDGNDINGGISLPLSSATAPGLSTINMVVTTHYRTGVSNTHRVQSEVVFGHSTDGLQVLVSDARRAGEVVEVSVPDGIYVGPLDVVGVKVNASENFYLYLYETPASGLSSHVGVEFLMLEEGSAINGGNYYLNGRSLVIKQGTSVSNATFNMRDGNFGVATIEGQSSFVANKFLGTVNDGSIWDWGAAFWLRSGPYAFTLHNNFFESQGNNHQVISTYADDVDVDLMNNTFINIGGLIEHRAGSTAAYTLSNNLVKLLAGFSGRRGVFVVAPSRSDLRSLNVNNNILPSDWNAAEDGYISDNNIYTDTPMLDPDTFAPLPGSPAIDAGADLSAEFTTDLLGNPRPVGAGFDIGAIEVQAP